MPPVCFFAHYLTIAAAADVYLLLPQAPQAGEIASYKAEDGDAVEYGQSVVEIAPFFGGHIIGDSKYA